MAKLLTLIVIGFLAVALIRLLMAPLQLVVKLLINAAFGLVALFFLNMLAPITGVSLGMNFVNALVVGILGLPGLVLLILLTVIL